MKPNRRDVQDMVATLVCVAGVAIAFGAAAAGDRWMALLACIAGMIPAVFLMFTKEK